MWWRVPRAEFRAGQKSGGARNKAAFRRVVRAGREPGILAYAGREPVGWCALAPRAEYVGLAKARVLKPVDEKPVWSVSCFFIARDFRRQGLTVQLLRQAAAFARKKGAMLLEGYPVDPGGETPAAFAWTGLAAAFSKAGFCEVARRSVRRPIMRKALK